MNTQFKRRNANNISEAEMLAQYCVKFKKIIPQRLFKQVLDQNSDQIQKYFLKLGDCDITFIKKCLQELKCGKSNYLLKKIQSKKNDKLYLPFQNNQVLRRSKKIEKSRLWAMRRLKQPRSQKNMQKNNLHPEKKQIANEQQEQLIQKQCQSSTNCENQ